MNAVEGVKKTYSAVQRDLRVLHIVPALFSSKGGIVGGAERYVLELARHMAEQTPTRLIAFGEKDEETSVGCLKLRVIGKAHYVRGQRSNPVSLRLLPELRKADVIHCHQQHVLISSLAAVISRALGKRVFVTDLGGGGWDISGYFSTDRWYHGHLHISEYSRNTFGHGGLPCAHVIYGGVDVNKFVPPITTPRRERVLYVGRLMPHKGVDDLMGAVSSDLPLTLFGNPYHDRFLADLHQLAQGKRVEFRHDCEDEELVREYQNALCVVLPSVYRDRYGSASRVPELLGQTLIEGMACGTPAICTDVASMPEVVENGVTGFIVPPNNPPMLRDRLLWLRDHPEQAGAMGRAGRQRVLERFTWPVVVNRCLTTYMAAGEAGRTS